MNVTILNILKTGTLGSDDVSALNIVFIVAVCLLIVFILYFLIKSSGKNKQFPIEHVTVTVADKWQQVAGNDRVGQYSRNMPLQMDVTLYTVRFQSSEGDNMDFLVSEKEYGNLMIGMKGVLSYQHQKFIAFK
ncbi:MAG: DUF2500 domain-containing protein [Clostridiales bacterium]|nr:DUF2500 domain-containing protein [Clostridiales bacterium]